MLRRHTSLSSAALLILTGTSSVASAQDLKAPPPIAPPPPMSPSTPGSPAAPGQPGQPVNTGEGETNRMLDEAEQKDSGRNFELFWIDGMIGGSYINMRQFSADTFQLEKASAGGPMFSLGAGFRLVMFVAGARIRHHALSSFNMWQVNAEAGLKIPISSIDLLFQLHGGYSFVGRLGEVGLATNTDTPTTADAVSVRGFNGGLDVGFDYYVSPLFSVGAGLLADFLFLNRPPAEKPAGLTPAQEQAIANDPLYQKSGTSVGFQLAGGLRLGLHIGL